jgi:sugar O-acyltransferase (sialic acid O-acetyltransferase NeuD family)
MIHMKKQLVIVGTGLFAEVAHVYFEELGGYEVVAFACHDCYKSSDTLHGLPLLPIESLARFHAPSTVELFVAIGYGQMNRMRQHVYEEMKASGYRFATFIHPNVRIWNSTTIGENVFIFENNTIQPFTCVGNNSILWSGNHFGHHGVIGNHCFISSHVVISGYCTIENNVFIGVNATLGDGITVAKETLIGAGAVIMKNTKPKEVYPSQRTKPFPKNSEQIGF